MWCIFPVYNIVYGVKDPLIIAISVIPWHLLLKVQSSLQNLTKAQHRIQQKTKTCQNKFKCEQQTASGEKLANNTKLNSDNFAIEFEG